MRTEEWRIRWAEAVAMAVGCGELRVTRHLPGCSSPPILHGSSARGNSPTGASAGRPVPPVLHALGCVGRRRRRASDREAAPAFPPPLLIPHTTIASLLDNACETSCGLCVYHRCNSIRSPSCPFPADMTP